MPEAPQEKIRSHPWKSRSKTPPIIAARAGEAYAEAQVTSNFTFLTGASHPEELVTRAAELGHAAAAIADRHTLAGVVRAHVAAKEAGIPLAVGCAVETGGGGAQPGIGEGEPGVRMLLFPTCRASYGGLCRLLTTGKRRASKGGCLLSLGDVLERSAGLQAVLIPPGEVAGIDGAYLAALESVREAFGPGDRLSVAASCASRGDDADRLWRSAALAGRLGVPLLATNDAHCHDPSRRQLQDVLACIRHGCTLDEAGFRLHANAERHMKPASEMARLFAACPGATARAAEVSLRGAAFSLDELRYEYPEEVCPPGESAMAYLTRLAWEGARERYPGPGGVPGKVRRQVAHELSLIEELRYAPYFLTVHDIVRHARSRGILCQGRGAAANSAVCYCLGVTAVDPERIDVLFERFVSRERNEPPDIDIDFEHERREEVIQYLYGKYGRERAALTAEVISYRGRSAVREVGKALGLSLDLVDRLAKSMDWWERGVVRPERLREHGVDPGDPTIGRLLRLAGEIMGFPRHLSQHVGGFVITRGPLCESVPIENAAMPGRTIIEWDKDDIEAVGMLKVDVLGLGMLTALRKSLSLANQGAVGGEGPGLALHTIPPEDGSVYDMLCAADTVGVFQIESRAQMSMLPRLRPRCFYDLVIEVAIVRPGPIQGDMVHPYLRRRSGEEPAAYPDEKVRSILGRTLGVPLFQEQAMSLAIHCAGFTPGEADGLRRAIAAWKSKQKVIHGFGEKIVEGMIARGYDRAFAERCFEQIKGFSEYGFPESHAASFALLVYASAWLKKHRPAAFAAGILNSQPMGFYAPAQIVRDAKEHGVAVLPIDANRSGWDCSLEEATGEPGDGAAKGPALRLGMRLVAGLGESEGRRIESAARERGPFGSVAALRRASGVRAATLKALASADALGSMGLDRQRALWAVRGLRDEPMPLFDAPEREAESGPSPAPAPRLPRMHPLRQVARDYAATGLSLKAHPLRFLRSRLAAMGATPNADIRDAAAWPKGRPVAVAGLVLVRQRPGTASGVVFMTIEDETGVANLILWPRVYERWRRAARHATAVLARGKVEREGEVVHVIVRSVRDLSAACAEMPGMSRDFH